MRYGPLGEDEKFIGFLRRCSDGHRVSICLGLPGTGRLDVNGNLSVLEWLEFAEKAGFRLLEPAVPGGDPVRVIAPIDY